jgi:hypothetical protein
MLRVSLVVLILLTVGCVSGTVERRTDKETCTASYSSVLKDISGLKLASCHSKAEVDSSMVNIDALIAILQILKGQP